MHELYWIITISVIFFAFFVIAEIMRKNNCEVEVTRKFVHFAGAFATLFFPFIFNSHYSVLFLSIAFALIMLFTKKFGLLQSIHGVERKSEGAIYHPIAVYTCFLYSQFLNQPWFYVIAISILAISDASAALVGKTYGMKEYVVEEGTRKTAEGSLTFLLTSFLITHLILLLATNLGRLESVLVALLIAVLSTIFESISLKGADNLFIPLAVMFILSKNITPTVHGISFQLLILCVFLLGYLVAMFPYKRIGFSGVLLLGLINYVVWALLGNIYGAIVLCFSFVCAKTNLILNYDCEESDAYRVRPIFYIMAIPIICAFLGEFIGHIVLYPFIASIICEGIIIKTRMFHGNLNKGLLCTSIVSVIILGASYVFIR